MAANCLVFVDKTTKMLIKPVKYSVFLRYSAAFQPSITMFLYYKPTSIFLKPTEKVGCIHWFFAGSLYFQQFKACFLQ